VLYTVWLGGGNVVDGGPWEDGPWGCHRKFGMVIWKNRLDLLLWNSVKMANV